MIQIYHYKNAFFLILILFSIIVGTPKAQSQILEAQHSYDGKATWSPDSNILYFISGRAGNADVWSFEFENGTLRNLTEFDLNNNSDMSISPDGKYITYLSSSFIDDQLVNEIWLLSLQRDEAINITGNIKNDFVLYSVPEWHPEENKFSFLAHSGEQTEILIYDIYLKNILNLTQNINRKPSIQIWSAEGDAIIMSLLGTFEDPSSVWKITLMDNTISNITPQLSNDVNCEYPRVNELSLSPNDMNIAIEIFCMSWDNKTDIFIFDLEQEDFVFLTDTENHASRLQADWAPDSLSIVFQSSAFLIPTSGTEINIYTLNISDMEIYNVTSDMSGVARLPAWSPTGNQIAFESDIDGDFDIWVINLDDSSKVKLTSDN